MVRNLDVTSLEVKVWVSVHNILDRKSYVYYGSITFSEKYIYQNSKIKEKLVSLNIQCTEPLLF